jgi:hypothetical protein
LEASILGDCDPSEIELSQTELKAETILLNYVGKKIVSLGANAARLTTWPQRFFEEKDDDLRRAAFVAYWLSKCVFGEYLSYTIKPLYFRLDVKISAGTSFALAAMFLGQFYTQLDLLHTDKMAGESCYTVTTVFNSSVLQAILWEHAKGYSTNDRRPSELRQKFAKMPEAVAARFEFLKTSVPSVYRWIGFKFYDLELVPSLDEEESVLWRPYSASYRGYSCSSVMSWFSRIEPQNYALGPNDMRILSYLSATSASWLPVLTYDGLRFTPYCVHKVRRQFGFDQEVPAIMEIVADVLPTINPFIKSRAFHYWSSTISEVVIPSGERVGICTMGMNHYW